MNSKILVSVIIPTYKRSVQYLSRAVNSVLNQTYPHVEIVVVDDSPADYAGRMEIFEYIKKVISGDNRIVYLQNEKSVGGSLARNRGVDACTGEYVTFLDDDDEYRSEKIEQQLSFMLKENCDMSFSNMVMYDNDGNVVDFRDRRDITSFENTELLKYHLTHKITGTPTFMYRTEKLRSIGGFDDAKMGQEFYLMLKTIKANLTIRYLDRCDVVVYKHQDGGISQGKNKIFGENAVYNCVKEHFEILSVREQMYARFRHWAVMVVAYKRNKMYVQMAMATITAFVVSPVDFCCEIGKFAINLLKKY